MRHPTLILLTILVAAVAARADDAVRVEETDAAIVADNGIVSLTLDRKSGQVSMIRYRRGDGPAMELSKPGEGLYWDANVDLLKVSDEMASKQPKAGYSRMSQYLKAIKIAKHDADVVDIMITGGPSYWFPFEVENHIVLQRGQSGFYAYTVLHHDKGMPGAKLAQTRLVLKGIPGNKLFTHFVVDDLRKNPQPTSPAVETIQDATERLADGTSFTKYNLSAFTRDYLAHGLVGKGVGLWVCYPTTESFNGGPIRQDLTVHNDNVLLAMWQSQHFGAGPVAVADDERWSHLYGPVFIYVNSGETVDAMHADAKQRARAEQQKWPYAWLKHDAYPLRRGAVSGAVQKTAGQSAAGAWAVLCQPEDIDWAEAAKGYTFYTRVNADGTFAIRNVRPGQYRLIISGGDEPQDFRADNVTVTADGTTDLGKLTWTPPTNGRRLWQIGTFDRSTQEYRFGQEQYYRDYDAFRRYFEAFPEDVTFTIGKSREATDWAYAQWVWFNKRPVWTVKFDVEKLATGKATLTVGFAAARPAGALQVAVNGKQVASLQLAKSGAAGYRSGGQDSHYTVEQIEFDAALLHVGANEITFGHSKAVVIPAGDALTKAKRPPGEVMYDAIRLEVR